MSVPGRRPIRPLILGLVCLALVGSGCSSGHSTDATGTGGTGPTGPTGGAGIHPGAEPVAGAVAPDEPHLLAIMLSPGDLPAGWTPRPSGSTPLQRAGAGLAMAQCLGRRNIDVNQVAGVVSQDFTKGGATIMSSARSYLNDDDIATATASYTNPKAPSCYQQLTAVPGATQSLTVKITPGPGQGPSNVLATASFTNGPPTAGTPTLKTTKAARTATTVKPAGGFGMIVFISGPRLIAELDLFGSEADLPAQLRSDLISKVAARAAKP